jgi:hypothetical protein
MTDLLPLLKGVGRSGDGWTARCPAHDDGHSSLTIHHRDGRWLVKCHAGCKWQAIIAAIGLVPADLFDERNGREGAGAPVPATAQLRNRPLEHRRYQTLRRFQRPRVRGRLLD